MAVSVDVNVDKFRARLSAMQMRGFRAREAFVLSMGAIFLQHVVKFSPRDTHRYVRGWMLAAEGARLRVGPIPKIRESKRADTLRKLLKWQLLAVRKQVQLEEMKLAWYEQESLAGRKRPKIGYYNKLVNRIFDAKQRAERAKEEFAKAVRNTDAIVIMRGSGAAMNGYEKRISGTALNLTVREKIYGGRGRLIRGNSIAGLSLHNLEPHCRVVERFSKPVGKAKAALSVAGIQKLKPEYVQELVKKTKGFSRYGSGLRRNSVI